MKQLVYKTLYSKVNLLYFSVLLLVVVIITLNYDLLWVSVPGTGNKNGISSEIRLRRQLSSGAVNYIYFAGFYCSSFQSKI